MPMNICGSGQSQTKILSSLSVPERLLRDDQLPILNSILSGHEDFDFSNELLVILNITMDTLKIWYKPHLLKKALAVQHKLTHGKLSYKPNNLTLMFRLQILHYSLYIFVYCQLISRSNEYKVLG